MFTRETRGKVELVRSAQEQDNVSYIEQSMWPYVAYYSLCAIWQRLTPAYHTELYSGYAT